MKLPLIALAVLPLAACAVERQVTSTTIVASVTPAQQEACRTAAASARGVAPEMVTATSATATATGPVVMLMVGGDTATCKLNELGEVQDVTFAGM